MKMTHLGKLGIVAVTAGLAGAPALAQSAGSLEARVTALEAREAAAATAAKATVSPTGLTLSFYGYVKADAVYDDSYDLGNTTAGFAGINAATEENSASRIHAYESRVGIRGSQLTDFGEVKFNIEGDFLGSGGGTFRLRQAFGDFNGLLAGQTWSLFNPVAELPAYLDAANQIGAPAFRVGQIRYTREFGNTVAAVSLEEDWNASQRARVAVVAAVTQKFEGGSVKLAGISRSLEQGNGDETSSWGVTISANARPWQGGLIQASYTQGAGISSLLPAWHPTYAPELDAAGDAIDAKGYGIAVSHEISPRFSIGAGYGVNDHDSYSGLSSDGTSKLSAAHVNVKYRPVEKVMFGLEYIRSERRQYDGARFENNRIQFAAQYLF